MPFNDTIDRLHVELTRIFKETHDYRERYKNAPAITWSWVATRTAHIMKTYPTGITDTILLSDLETLWEHHCLLMTSQKFDTILTKYDLDAREHTLFLDCRITALEFKHDTILRLATLKDDSYKELDMYLPLKSNPWFATPSPISPHLHQFGNHRHIQFRCPPRTNTPLLANYDANANNTTTMPTRRSDRVITCAPTNDCIWHLRVDDTAWIRDVFWRDTFATLTPLPPPSDSSSTTARFTTTTTKQQQPQLWVKVIHVEKDDLTTTTTPAQQWLHQKRTFQQPQQPNQQGQRQHRKDIYIVDRTTGTNTSDPALLSLYDDQADLTRMVQRGDYLGLYHPVVVPPHTHTPSQEQQTDLVFEWGPHTMVFLMTNKHAELAGLAHVMDASSSSSSSSMAVDMDDNNNDNDEQEEDDGASSPIRDFFGGQRKKRKKAIMARDEEGLMDCLEYVPRINISDLAPVMSNVTLSGRLIAKANNNPFIDPTTKKRMDRYALRIEDGSGKVDVTLWEQTGHQAKSLRVGERLVLTGLSTSVKHTTATGQSTWYVNGSVVYGTMIYNVSQCECLLVSHGFGTMIPLHTIQGEGQWETQATIVGWKLRGLDPTVPALFGHDMPVLEDEELICLGDYIVVQAHVDCLEMLPGNQQQCDYCAKTSLMEDEKIWVYRQRKQTVASEEQRESATIGWIEWRLDDGHGVLDAYGAEQTILDCPAVEFMTFSPRLQMQLLDAVVGTQWSCSMSCVGTRGYRLDKVAPERQLQSKCDSLVKSLSDVLLLSSQ